MNPAEFANIAQSERNFWWYRGMRQIMFGMLDPLISPRHISRALEAGCGTGYFSKLVEQRYEFPVVPVDLRMEGLEHAKRMGLRRLAQCDAGVLPFAGESFGLVLSLDVLVHLAPGAETQALREFARVLTPNGLLAIRVSAFDFLRSRHSEFAHERQRFTRTRLIRSISAAGLRLIRASYANSLLMPIALAKFRIWEPLFQKEAASGVTPVSRWLDSALHAPLALESRMIGKGWNLPTGQSLIVIAEKPGQA